MRVASHGFVGKGVGGEGGGGVGCEGVPWLLVVIIRLQARPKALQEV